MTRRKDYDVARPLTDDEMRMLNGALELAMKIGRDAGITNILDKNRYRDVQMAYDLNAMPFKKASGGAFGADAISGTGRIIQQEYKTATLKEDDLDKFERTGKVTVQMVYNGAYREDSIMSYLDSQHFIGLYDGALPIFIGEVDAEDIVEALLMHHAKRKEHNRKALREGREEKTTNCNSVRVAIDVNSETITVV